MAHLAQQLFDAASHHGTIIATAESCTGGMIAAAITDIAGSSQILDRGFVTYSNAAKTQMLGVRPETLQTFGAVSDEVAAEMAEGALRNSNATLAVSVTGIAGPGGAEFKPEGRVCFGVATAGRATATETVEFGAIGRARVRKAATSHALGLLLAAVG
jgi:nicotinamide-nucleotide amidase